MTKTLTPALSLALSYVYITGQIPSHIHMDTRLALGVYTVDLNFVKTGKFYDLTEEGVAAIQDEPLYKSHQYLLSLGFTPRLPPRCRSSHYIDYYNRGDGRSATSYRKSGWIEIHDPFVSHSHQRLKVPA